MPASGNVRVPSPGVYGPHQDQGLLAQRTVEWLLPAGAALLPLGLVFERVLPSGTLDGVFVLLVGVSAVLVAAFARVSPASIILACGGLVIVGLTGRPNLVGVTLIPLLASLLTCLDISRVARRFAFVGVLVVAMVTGMYYFSGFNKEYDQYAWREYAGAFMERYSLGFSHPNRAMMEVAVAAIAVIVATENRRRRGLSFMLLGAASLVFVATDSRTSGGLLIVFLIAAILWPRGLERQIYPFGRSILLVAPWCFALGSFALAALASVPALDHLLSGRPRLYSSLLTMHPILSLTGQESLETAIVDNGYISMALTKGSILFFLYLVCLTNIIKRVRYVTVRSAFISIIFLSLALFETTLLEFALIFMLLVSLEIDARRQNSPVPTPSLPEWARSASSSALVKSPPSDRFSAVRADVPLRR